MLSAFRKLVEKYEEDIEVTKSVLGSHQKLGARMQAINDLEPKASHSSNIMVKHHHKASSVFQEEISKMQSEVRQPVEDIQNVLISAVAALTRRNLLLQENVSQLINLKSLMLESTSTLNK